MIWLEIEDPRFVTRALHGQIGVKLQRRSNYNCLTLLTGGLVDKNYGKKGK